MLFNTTIYKNVEHGLIGTLWEHESDEKKAMLIETACRDAFADEFINRLPDVSISLYPHDDLITDAEAALPNNRG